MHSTNTFGESRYATETPDQKESAREQGERFHGGALAKPRASA
jgi:hypothetical protein